jgi:hypothetical protein
MRKGERRNYSGTTLKNQRIDKRYPKGFDQTTVEDLGRKYKVTRHKSRNVDTNVQFIDKRNSHKWRDLYNRNGLWIRKSLVSGEVHAWHRVGKASEYIGRLENLDLWALGKMSFTEVQAFTETINRVRGTKVYRQYRLSLTKAPKELFDGRKF